MRPELLNELVSAAQEVVNSEELGHFSAGADIAAVGRDDLDRLRKVVQEISDEACAEVSAERPARTLFLFRQT